MSAIAPAFINALKGALQAQSNESEEPPTLVSTASKSRVQSLLSLALSDGATFLHGSLEDEANSNGAMRHAGVRMAPVLLGHVKEHMQVWQEEAFASVSACMVVDSEEEAVRIANKGGYGLSASVFTEDLRKGFTLSKQLESG